MGCDLNAISATRQDICYMARASYILYFSVTDLNGDPVDLSGKSLIFEIKKKRYSSSSVAELTSEITITGADDNIVGLPFDFDLEERRYHYGLKNLTDDEPMMEGWFDVTESVND